MSRHKYFVTEHHFENYLSLAHELAILHLDNYWNSLIYIISSDQRLFSDRYKLLNLPAREINSEFFFSNPYSSGECALLELAYNLYTDQSYYEFEDGEKIYISPISVFVRLDKQKYEIAKNSLDVRLYGIDFNYPTPGEDLIIEPGEME